MNIIFLVNKCFLYRFQSLIIEETKDRFPEAKIFLFINLDTHFKYKWSKGSFLQSIDRRFSNLTSDPLAVIELKNFQKKFPWIVLIRNIGKIPKELSINWGIYLYPEPEVVTSHVLIFKNLIKIKFDEAYWSHCSINKHEYTYITILKFYAFTKEWVPLNTLGFSTQKGLINNRNKALFYYSILMVKSLSDTFNNTLENKIKSPKLLKRYNYLSILKYYSTLLILLVLRKINKKRLNWKIALKQNNKLFYLKQPDGSFWADPFIFKEDKLFIFIEDFNYKTNLGEIALLEINNEFEVKNKSTIMKEEFHLSFPNVFKIGEEFYMIPETSAINKVCIYKSNFFPYNWTLQTEIMTGIKLIDAVWFFHNGYYWLFANRIHKFESDNNECLYLYYSKDLFSKNWKSHLQNPVVIDLEKSRNAGQIFKDNGKIYRPSQNCKYTYGASIIMNEITELSPEKYNETIKYFVKPEIPFIGVHTYNKSGNLEVLDFLKEE